MTTIAYDTLAALTPTDTVEAALYTVGTGKQIVAQLTVALETTTSQSYRVGVLKNGAGSVVYRAYDVTLGEQVIPDTYLIVMGEGDQLKVTSGSANNVSFTLEGAEVS
jgi:hypothetical protein